MLYKHAASAVKWLQDQLPSVPDAIISTSAAPSPLWHPFFKDHKAKGVFADANEPATYISKASQRCRQNANRLSTDEVLNFFGNHRRICHSDIKPDNFLLNQDGLWIVDFQHISVLPEVYQSYAYFNIGMSFVAERDLGVQREFVCLIDDRLDFGVHCEEALGLVARSALWVTRRLCDVVYSLFCP